MTLAIGMLGAGRMGAPICRSLVEGGFSVVTFDPAAEGRHAVEAAGATWAADPARVADHCDVLITVLPGPNELELALSGRNGALVCLRPGSLWLDFTSGDPRVSERLAGEAGSREIAVVGAPLGGGPGDAERRTLTFFVDGPAEAIERVRPILGALGKPTGIRIVGAHAGQAQIAKLLANLLWFGQAAAVTEALLLGQALGVDLASLRDALRTSAGASTFLGDSTDALLRGDYLESFALARCVDELQTLMNLAAEQNSPFDLSSQVTRLHQEALADFGDIDGELLVARLLETRAGRTLRAAPIRRSSSPQASSPQASS